MIMELTHFSLCSGIGGLDLAAEQAGFRTAAQCEIDEYASKVLAKNFKGVPNLHDIRTVTDERLAEFGIDAKQITVVSAGFPCQPYSLAGKGRGDRDSRDLWGEVARVLGEIKPRWFVGENTPGLFARQNQRYFRRVLDDLTALGYSVGWGIWGACDIGAPHRRERVFIIANRIIPDAVIERCDPNEIQRGEFAESGNEKNARRVQKSGLQSERVCGGIPYSARDVMGLFRGAGETQRTRSERNNYGNGAQRYAGGEWWETEPDMGGSIDGFSDRLDKIRGLNNLSCEAPSYYAKAWEDGSWESGIERVLINCSHRVDRLRCLGNAVVPAQAYPIFKAIADYERSDK